jgi:hypothetical protein
MRELFAKLSMAAGDGSLMKDFVKTGGITTACPQLEKTVGIARSQRNEKSYYSSVIK